MLNISKQSKSSKKSHNKLIDMPAFNIKKAPSYYSLIKGTVVYVIFYIICFGKLDPDFGWHLQAGHYFRSHGVPAKDVFSYTAEHFHWINHEWAADIFVSYIHGWGGFALLALLYAGIWTAAVMLAAPKTRFLTLLLGVGALLPYVAIRPLAWTALFFVLVQKACSGKSIRQKIALPALFVVWANIHAGFIVGFFLVLYYGIKNKDKKLMFIFPLTILATFINPYGPRLYEEIYRTIFDSSVRFQIVEWLPVAFWGSTLLFTVVWATGFILFDWKKLKNWFGLGPIFLAAGLLSTRNIPFFVITSIKDLDRYYDRFVAELPKNGTKNIMFAKKLVLLILIGTIVLWFGLSNKDFYKHITLDREINQPRQSIDYITANGCSGNIFNSYDFGGYLIWRLPEYRVYIDGRMPTWKDEEGTKYMDKYFEIYSNDTVLSSEFEKYNIKCVIVSSGDNKFIEKLKKADWEVKINEPGAVLLVRP